MTMSKFAILAGVLLSTALSSGAAFAQTTLSMWYHGAG